MNEEDARGRSALWGGGIDMDMDGHTASINTKKERKERTVALDFLLNMIYFQWSNRHHFVPSRGYRHADDGRGVRVWTRCTQAHTHTHAGVVRGTNSFGLKIWGESIDFWVEPIAASLVPRAFDRGGRRQTILAWG